MVTGLKQWQEKSAVLVSGCIALTRGLRQRWKAISTAAAQSISTDDDMFRAVELAVDNLYRRGEATSENIRQVVVEISETYEGKRVGNGDS